MKKINLQIDKNIVGLAGYQYGEQIFNEQVEPLISKEDYKSEIKIKLPDHVLRVASSFVQGFSEQLIEELGYYGFVDHIKFDTSSHKLTKYIYESLE